jgi:hypothetical protein
MGIGDGGAEPDPSGSNARLLDLTETHYIGYVLRGQGAVPHQHEEPAFLPCGPRPPANATLRARRSLIRDFIGLRPPSITHAATLSQLMQQSDDHGPILGLSRLARVQLYFHIC